MNDNASQKTRNDPDTENDCPHCRYRADDCRCEKQQHGTCGASKSRAELPAKTNEEPSTETMISMHNHIGIPPRDVAPMHSPGYTAYLAGRRQRVAEMVGRGMAQRDIATREKVSPKTIEKDWDAVRREWFTNRVDSYERIKAQAMSTAMAMITEAFQAWERSQTPEVETETEERQSVQASGKSGRSRKRTERTRSGNPAYLEVVSRGIDHLRKIGGLDVQKHAFTEHGGQKDLDLNKVFANMSDEQLALMTTIAPLFQQQPTDTEHVQPDERTEAGSRGHYRPALPQPPADNAEPNRENPPATPAPAENDSNHQTPEPTAPETPENQYTNSNTRKTLRIDEQVNIRSDNQSEPTATPEHPPTPQHTKTENDTDTDQHKGNAPQ